MNTNEAVGEVRKYARFIKAFEHLAEVADTLAKADNLVKEREEQAAKLQGLIDQNHAQIQAQGEELLAQRDHLSDQAAANKDECDAQLRQADDRAQEILAEAKRELDTLTEENHKAAVNLRAVRQQTTAVAAELDELQPKLAEARAQARLIIEGAA